MGHGGNVEEVGLGGDGGNEEVKVGHSGNEEKEVGHVAGE